LKIAVVSPFLDRRHGAERCVVEEIEYFCRQPGTQVHIYAQRLEDFDFVRYRDVRRAPIPASKPVWHRLPALPGPHLLNYIWWFFANTWLRWRHRTFCSLDYDVVFSPGINCPDADAIVVHVVFHEFFRHVRESLRLGSNPLRSWPAAIHRNFYYRLIMFLENRIYADPKVRLAAVSNLTARELAIPARRSDITVIPNAVDTAKFNTEQRLQRRAQARVCFGLQDSDFALLLLGNGWVNKGLGAVLQAMAFQRDLPLRLLVVGRDDRSPFLEQIRSLQLNGRVSFIGPSPDVLQFYAAADVYVGPSLHDSFALPPLEAMACGLPVITSAQNGGAQVISEGSDGFVLDDPSDSSRLGELLRRLWQNPETRRELGLMAARTAEIYHWERNAHATWLFLRAAGGQKELSPTDAT
jgi:UDP-glucose:(heptosyl)LPS alpha-1,3-glucosyltransferase